MNALATSTAPVSVTQADIRKLQRKLVCEKCQKRAGFSPIEAKLLEASLDFFYQNLVDHLRIEPVKPIQNI